MLGSIDANTGTEGLGWDTDQVRAAAFACSGYLLVTASFGRADNDMTAVPHGHSQQHVVDVDTVATRRHRPRRIEL